jgi:hypothetical protein
VDSWLQVASESMNQWSGKQSVDMKIVNTLKAEVQELRNLLIQEKVSNQERKSVIITLTHENTLLYSSSLSSVITISLVVL